MKIAFIIASLEAGGAERVLVSLANSLVKTVEVEVISFSDKKSFYPLEKSVKLTSLKQLRYDTLARRLINKPLKLYNLRKALKNSKASIFISFLDTTNILCVLASAFLKKPLIISEHSSHTYLKPPFLRLLRRLCYPFASALCVLTHKDLEFYKSFVKSVHVMPNPCTFATLKKQSFKKEPIILLVARLDENKNPFMFINALKLVKEDFKAYIIGDGPLFEEVVKKTKDLSKVKCLGKVKNLQNIYEKAYIICLCSYIEGLPSVLVESIYFDIARVSTPYQLGFSELLKDGFDSLVVKDARSMGKAISELLKDTRLKNTLCENARLKEENFHPKSVALKWLSLINSTLGLN